MESLASSLRILKHGRAWTRGHFALLRAGVYHRNRIADLKRGDDEHLRAAASWLERAQDAMSDGGVAGRYRLDRGWTSSYPETTGYLVPTFLALARHLEKPEFVERARRAIEFLLALQLHDGAFPGLEVAENRTNPSPFNTAQILHGLVAWHRHGGDARTLAAARRAGDWLLSVQDEDGAWRRHVYMGHATTYTAHASCWLAELGAHCGDRRYLDGAERHLDWVLGHVDRETGFIDGCGFSPADHEARRAVTHTLAYTLEGVLRSSEILKRGDGIAAVRAAADRIRSRVERTGELPGVLDSRFRPAAKFACLTGNAQMALIFLRLATLDGDGRFANAAMILIDRVKAAQPLDNPNPGIRGGIAGSDPAWGDYIRLALPNWAAKFFIDALLAKRAWLEAAARSRSPSGIAPSLAPRALPPAPARTGSPPRIVLLATPGSAKCAKLRSRLNALGVAVHAVVLEQRGEPPARARLARMLRDGGMRALTAKLGGARPDASANHAAPPDDGTRVVRVGPLETDAARDAIAALQPDVLVLAGVGILREPILALPRLAVINAHMGLLPGWRGMNVAEWAAFHGDPNGATVHCVVRGIDEGDVLCARDVATDGVRSIAELRERVDAAQLDLLAEVLRWCSIAGELPPRHRQDPREGRTFHRMHPEIAALVEGSMQGAR